MIEITNIEEESYYDVYPRYTDPKPGICALLRVREEEQWMSYSIDSILDRVDSLKIFVQGIQNDRTADIAEYYAKRYKHVSCYYFPFVSRPNGPDHDLSPYNSVYARSYFYNWCLSHCDREYALKWDGDLVAMDTFQPRNYVRPDNVVLMRGLDLLDLHTECSDPVSGSLNMFRNDGRTYWMPGPVCEVTHTNLQHHHQIEGRPHFLHFKWYKSLGSATKAWPSDWQEIDHFRQLYRAKTKPGKPYKGPYPKCLTPLISVS